jgi:predicted DNA-binding protein (UPF0251 family)
LQAFPESRAKSLRTTAEVSIATFWEWRHDHCMGNGPNSPRHISSNVTATASRHVLPNDLPAAVKHLEDQELEQLLDAVVAERLRRGKKSPVLEKTPSQRTVDAGAVSLNLGKLNAVRAAFKAGVTPSKIAKEFGISQAAVRKVIASEGLKR